MDSPDQFRRLVELEETMIGHQQNTFGQQQVGGARRNRREIVVREEWKVIEDIGELMFLE